MPEDRRLAAVVEEERRQEPDQRRLPRAVLAENRHALAALDAELDVLQGSDATAAREPAVASPEFLPEAAHLDGG